MPVKTPAAMDWCQRLIDHPIRPLDKAQALALQARLAERNGRWTQAEQDYALLLKENVPDSLKQIAYLGQGRLSAAVHRIGPGAAGPGPSRRPARSSLRRGPGRNGTVGAVTRPSRGGSEGLSGVGEAARFGPR